MFIVDNFRFMGTSISISDSVSKFLTLSSNRAFSKSETDWIIPGDLTSSADSISSSAADFFFTTSHTNNLTKIIYPHSLNSHKHFLLEMKITQYPVSHLNLT
jgi:hypothetical protein